MINQHWLEALTGTRIILSHQIRKNTDSNLENIHRKTEGYNSKIHESKKETFSSKICFFFKDNGFYFSCPGTEHGKHTRHDTHTFTIYTYIDTQQCEKSTTVDMPKKKKLIYRARIEKRMQKN